MSHSPGTVEFASAVWGRSTGSVIPLAGAAVWDVVGRSGVVASISTMSISRPAMPITAMTPAASGRLTAFQCSLRSSGKTDFMALT
jgi:hypothetical protein